MNQYLEQTANIVKDNKQITIRRRIPINLPHDSDEYIYDYWTDPNTGDVYLYNIETEQATCVFNTVK